MIEKSGNRKYGRKLRDIRIPSASDWLTRLQTASRIADGAGGVRPGANYDFSF
jgi:hypothetical protein